MGRKARPRTEWRRSWDAPADANDHPSPDPPDPSGKALADWFLRLYADGTLTAKDVCTGCYFAVQAGAAGDVGKYALRPDSPSGHFQRHISVALPHSAAGPPPELYNVGVPLHRMRRGRAIRMIPFAPVHEALAQEAERVGLTNEQVHAAVGTAEWGPSFLRHPARRDAQASGKPCFPVALYLDSVRFTRSIMPGHQDALLNISCYNLMTHKRVFVGMLRKSEFCRCGCGGWCTAYPVWRFLEWCFLQALAGRRSLERHDGSAWPCDSTLGAKVVTDPELPAVFLMVQLKGDWAEFCQTLGYPTWSSSFSPCFMCNCTREQMYTFNGLSLARDPWGQRVAGEYEAGCRLCEVRITVATEEDRVAILQEGGLFYDRRKLGAKGGSCGTQCPAWGFRPWTGWSRARACWTSPPSTGRLSRSMSSSGGGTSTMAKWPTKSCTGIRS